MLKVFFEGKLASVNTHDRRPWEVEGRLRVAAGIQGFNESLPEVGHKAVAHILVERLEGAGGGRRSTSGSGTLN